MDISDELDQIENSDPLGGDMDGMDDMNAPMPPMDTEMPPMDDPNAQEPDPNTDGGAPGEDPMADDGQDPMPGDPNALSAGGGQDPNAGTGGDDIASKYQQLSPDQQKAADKYIDSMMNNESRFNFKNIIDEVFSELGNTKTPFDGTTRPEMKAAKEAVIDEDNPYMPL